MVGLDDARDVWRGLRTRPGFALSVVGCLALGIGANAAIFSLMSTLLLRPLPFVEADRLVALWSTGPNRARQPFSIPDFVDLQQRSRSFDTLAAVGGFTANMTESGEAERLQGLWSSPGLFSMLGVKLALGRAPEPSEEKAGGARVAVLGYGVWQRRFAADPAILGRTIRLNDESFSVIGVLPANFVLSGRAVDVVVPLLLDADARRGNRVASFMRPLARLKPGVSIEAAGADVSGIARQLQAEHPDSNATRAGVAVHSLHEEIVGRVRPMLLAMQAAVLLVLLIGAVNLALVLLTRTAARRRELAVRATLGASEGRLIRLVMAEGLLLSGAAGLVGLLLGHAFLQGLLAVGPPDLPRRAEVSLDPLVAVFAAVLALVTGTLASVVPALAFGRGATQEGLRGARGTATGAGGPARRLLVAFEVGLSLVLLAGAGLLVKSFVRLQSVDPGFDAQHLLTARLSLPRARYDTPASLAAFHDRLAPRLLALPGVTDLAAASFVPLTEWRATVDLEVEGRPAARPEDRPMAHYRMVSPGYLRTMRIPLLRGRDLEPSDKANGTSVALVSRSLAAKLWTGEDPVGRRLSMNDSGQTTLRQVEVVGVVGDVKDYGLEAATTDAVYVPLEQIPPSVAIWLANTMIVVARTTADPTALADSVRREVRAVDPEIPASVRSMEDALRASLGPRRFNLILVEAFAIAALLLAAIGTYAVNAQAVARRTRELGVRVALGARTGQILALVMRQGLGPVAVGLVIGAAVATGVLGFARSLLFEVSPHDPAVLLVGFVVLGLVAAVAVFVPAWRAARVHPARALRSE